MTIKPEPCSCDFVALLESKMNSFAEEGDWTEAKKCAQQLFFFFRELSKQDPDVISISKAMFYSRLAQTYSRNRIIRTQAV